MTFDLYVWHAPRDLDADAASALFEGWSGAADKLVQMPFEPSTDVAWFYRELMREEPSIEAVTDAVPGTSRLPIWLQTDDPRPARVVAIRLTPQSDRDDLVAIGSLAAKYDLVVFDARHGRVLAEPRVAEAEAQDRRFPALLEQRLQSIAQPAHARQ